MGARSSRWLWLWWISFPLMVAGFAYAMGGIGPGLLGLVVGGICTVIGARFYVRHEMPGSREAATPTGTGRAPVVLFRRLWLLLLLAVALGLLIAVASTGLHGATVAIACCWLLILVGGAGALAVMNKTDEAPNTVVPLTRERLSTD